MQMEMWRVIQKRTYQRRGSHKARSADVTITASTHRNLEAMIESGQFSEEFLLPDKCISLECAWACQAARGYSPSD
jgi:DNA-binding NtrC family response regulator